MFNAIMTRLGYERRADSSYTDALVAVLTSGAAGTSQALPTATAALESCAGLVGRAFASCEVMGPESVVKALTPDLLSMVGRALIRRGEILFSVDVKDGCLHLWPVSSHDICGDHDPATWKYRLNLAGPDFQTTIQDVSSENVVHICYARDPERPWRGYGPLQVAQLAGRLSASTAAALADEASGPRGSFLPMPGKDGKDNTTDALRGDIKTANGGMLTVESMASAWKSGEALRGLDAKEIRPFPPRRLDQAFGDFDTGGHGSLWAVRFPVHGCGWDGATGELEAGVVQRDPAARAARGD